MTVAVEGTDLESKGFTTLNSRKATGTTRLPSDLYLLTKQVTSCEMPLPSEKGIIPAKQVCKERTKKAYL